MTTEEYIRDPRFEALGLGVRFVNGDLKWFEDPDEFLHHFREEPTEKTAFLCHHAQFDGLILSHHFGVRPALWLDTLSMARMIIGNHLSVSLGSLAKHYGFANKVLDYGSFKGRHLAELGVLGRRHLAEGCLHDVNITWRLFCILGAPFPLEELRVIDLTIRMFTEPVLHGNVEALAKVEMDEERSKAGMLEALGIDAADLQSAETFATLLRAEGVEPAWKPGKNGQIYAFAKTDEFMKELIEDDGRAGGLARARLGVRSTIDQTRAKRLGGMATRGALPVYLRYCGAHTTRWSGGDEINWQNFRRGGAIRRAIEAPQGSSLIILDLAQIECRILNVLAGEEDVVEAFRLERDLYSETASRFYGKPITKADRIERHLGKILELGCGYGMGQTKLQSTCRGGALGGPPIILTDNDADSAIRAYRGSHPAVVAYWHTAGRMIARIAGGRGTYGPPIVLTEDECLKARDLYRSTHPHVEQRWRDAGRLLARIAGGPATDWGPMTIRDHRVYLPNGAWLNYDTLEYHRKESAYDPWDDSWRYRTRQGWTKLYGGKLVENVVQALARVVLSQAMLRIASCGYRIATCTHDEVMIVVDKSVEAAQDDYVICKAEMEKSPVWLPDLPVKAEGGVSTRYEK